MKNMLYTAGLTAAALVAQGQNTMTPELLWKLGRVGLEAVDAKGENVIYGITTYSIEDNKGERDLYMYNVKSGSPKQITTLAGSESGAQFLQGGKLIGFNHKGQFYTMQPDGSNVIQRTNVEGGVANAKAVELKDGRIVLLFSHAEKLLQSPQDMYPELGKADFKVIDNLMYRHWDSWSDESFDHACYLTLNLEGENQVSDFTDVMKGQRFDSPVPPFGGGESFDMSPDGKYLVYVAKKKSGIDFAISTASRMYLVELATGTTTELPGPGGYNTHPSFSPDGKYIAFLGMAHDGYESDQNKLHFYDMKTKEFFEVGVEPYVMDFTWKDSKTIVYSFQTMATQQIAELKIKKISKTGSTVQATVLTSGDYNYNAFRVAGDKVYAERQDINHATEIFEVYKKEAKAITHMNDAIYEHLDMPTVQKRMVQTSDGKEMLTWVILPPNFDETKKYPTLLYCQGGPQSPVSQFYSFRWNFQLMASMGYVVVAPNRRGVPGFGPEWNEAISKDWGGQPMRDYLAAIDDVAKEPWADEENLGAVGASYGGYSVYMLAGIHQKRFKAFVSHCGLFDLKSWYLSTEEMFFANWDIGGPFWGGQNSNSYQNYNPINFVQNWDTPILVIHGGKDFRVPENQGMEAFQAAQLRGIPSKFLYFPNEGHWVLKPQNGLVWHNEFFMWLDQWLKK